MILDGILMGHVNKEHLHEIKFCHTNMPGMLKEFSPKPCFSCLVMPWESSQLL